MKFANNAIVNNQILRKKYLKLRSKHYKKDVLIIKNYLYKIRREFTRKK